MFATYPRGMSTDNLHIKSIVSFILLILTLLSITYAAPRGQFALIVTNPFRSEFGAMEVISNAGGAVVSESNFKWITIAHSEDPFFTSRLRQAGALLVLNHQMAFGCLRN